MDYSLSIEEFNKNFSVKENKLTHNSGKKFRLFPFITKVENKPVKNLTNVAGLYINKIEEKESVTISMEELIKKLKEKTNIEQGQEELFERVIRYIFFDSEKRLLPINIRFLCSDYSKENNEAKIAEYLSDVLGDPEEIKKSIIKANKNLEKQSNVLERFVISNLERKSKSSNDTYKPYYRVIEIFKNAYKDDFDYILESNNRTKEYLVTLLEFYYFIYTSQMCLQLNRFLEGERNQCIPLYFSLDWEKTSQSRQCFNKGWFILEPAIKRMFSHAIVLEILNQTFEEKEIDYIELNNFIKDSEEINEKVSREIRKLTDLYREIISDCPTMKELERKNFSENMTADEVKFLFDSVDCQFRNTERKTPYSNYSKKFELFTDKFLKNRGRSGKMLNITEEMLIFLTKISIKNKEKIRLNDVFKEFETRGVFLDEISKENVMKYYEKLNLIEKKSDSGDAQYVKRIL